MWSRSGSLRYLSANSNHGNFSRLVIRRLAAPQQVRVNEVACHHGNTTSATAASTRPYLRHRDYQQVSVKHNKYERQNQGDHHRPCCSLSQLCQHVEDTSERSYVIANIDVQHQNSNIRNSNTKIRLKTKLAMMVAQHHLKVLQQQQQQRQRWNPDQQPYHSFSTSTRSPSSDDGSSSSPSSPSADSNSNVRSAGSDADGRSTFKNLYDLGHHHEELYRTIRNSQMQRRKTERDRTALNVQRAMFGNMVICTAKLVAWLSSGSSSMMSEFVHSVVDCGNQGLLLIGLRDSQNIADLKHPYGYGKSIYFWALVSALGTFFMGAGISMTHSINELYHPSIQTVIGNEVWLVLGFSFLVDGYVFTKTCYDVQQNNSNNNKSFFVIIRDMRDPATLAILLEDGAACLGVVLAITGIGLTHATGTPLFDGMAGVSISALLASMGFILARVNHRFLLGQAVDPEINEGIKKILLARRSIDSIQSIQSQWTGPETFSYKAEIDFDGTFLAAKLMPRYQHEFIQIQKQMNIDRTLDQSAKNLDTDTDTSSFTADENDNNYSQAAATSYNIDSHSELKLLLSWYAEDVIRTVEREVRHIEALIRKQYPGAEYIELEPMSKFADKYAIDDSDEAELRRIETEALGDIINSLNKDRIQQQLLEQQDEEDGDNSK